MRGEKVTCCECGCWRGSTRGDVQRNEAAVARRNARKAVANKGGGDEGRKQPRRRRKRGEGVSVV